MALYLDLYDLSDNPALLTRIAVAVSVAGEAIRVENPATTNHAARMVWAKAALQNPLEEARKIVWSILAQNKAASTAQIIGADDATVQAAVNNTIDLLI